MQRLSVVDDAVAVFVPLEVAYLPQRSIIGDKRKLSVHSVSFRRLALYCCMGDTLGG
jgi:hypothetical protein